MDIDLLAKMVKEAILDHDTVTLPGVGCFVAELMPSTFSDKGYTINPPYRRLSFLPRQGTDTYLASLYARDNEGVDLEMATRILTEFLAQMKEILKVRKTVVFPGLGRLRATRENHFFFVADEDLDIYPEGMGLAPISLKTHAESPEEVATAVAGLAGLMKEPVAVADPVVEPQPEPVVEPQQEPVAEPQQDPEPFFPEPEPFFVPDPVPAEPEPGTEPESGPESEPGSDAASGKGPIVPDSKPIELKPAEPKPEEPKPEEPKPEEPEPQEPKPEAEPAAKQPVEEKPADGESEPTPPVTKAEPKPVEAGPEPTPAETKPEPKPAETKLEPKPAEINQEPKPAGTKPEPVQAKPEPKQEEKWEPLPFQRPPKTFPRPLKKLLVFLGFLLVLVLAYMLIGRFAPDLIDPLLYSREELELLHP